MTNYEELGKAIVSAIENRPVRHFSRSEKFLYSKNRIGIIHKGKYANGKMDLSPRTEIQITHANPYLYVVKLTTHTDVGTV